MFTVASTNFLPATYRSFTLVLGPTYQAPICQGPYIKVISPGQLPVHSKAFSCTHSSASPKHLSGHKVLWIQKGNILGWYTLFYTICWYAWKESLPTGHMLLSSVNKDISKIINGQHSNPQMQFIHHFSDTRMHLGFLFNKIIPNFSKSFFLYFFQFFIVVVLSGRE